MFDPAQVKLKFYGLHPFLSHFLPLPASTRIQPPRDAFPSLYWSLLPLQCQHPVDRRQCIDAHLDKGVLPLGRFW